MVITNQKPRDIIPYYRDVISSPFDLSDIIGQTVTSQLLEPVLQNKPVTIVSQNGVAISEDDIKERLINCCADDVDTNNEAVTKMLLGETMLHYDKNTNMLVRDMFAVQSAVKENLHEPDDRFVYMAGSDVIPTSRQFISGTASYDKFFASLAYFARPQTLGFYFVNEMAFDDFQKWFSQQMVVYANTLSPEANKCASEFGQLKLPGLTESIILRDQDGDENEPMSFARLITSVLMNYTTVVSNAEFGVLPFDLGELLCPKTIVFVNVERHARATAKQVTDEWNMINKCINPQTRIKMISNKSLRMLTAAQRSLNKIMSQAVTQAMNQGIKAQRAANFRFSKTRPTNVDIAKRIKRLINKMAYINKSMNPFKIVHMSYMRPNRRDPDDYNKPGKSSSMKYKPDIHLYIDTSGSISERDYQDTVKACIQLAKAMQVNMYFNSFSHIMSQTTKLHLEGKSVSAIYAEFQKVHKVNGGTDYEQIWHFINDSKKRTRELSIIISDFEFNASSRFIHHPKNLYYVPCSTLNWDSIVRHADEFCKSAVHNLPDIRAHILF